MIQTSGISQIQVTQTSYAGFGAQQASSLHNAQAAAAPEIPDPVRANSHSEETTSENHAPHGQLSAANVTALQGEDTDAPTASNSQPDEAQAAQEEAEQAQIDVLQARDQEVRTHEQAHANAGGAYASSPSYEYQTGPDGKRYAVGGEVQIDTAPIAGDPSATIAKMEVVIRAALAPAEPSAQDKAVAAAASKQRAEAQAELNAQRQAERMGEAEPNDVQGTAQSAPTSGQGAEPIINLFA